MNTLALEHILTPLPSRFVMAFAVACSEEAMAKIKSPDPRSVKAIDLAKRYSLGEEGLEQELRYAANAAYTAAANTAYAANVAAAYAATVAATSAYAAYAATSAAAANTAYAATSVYAAAAVYAAAKSLGTKESYFKDKLIAMIKVEFTPFELIMWGLG